MGLFDSFSRPATEVPEHYVDLVRRVGRCEAETERLSLIWEAYRDELKRLVSRLEKRDQRAQARVNGDPTPPLDPVSARILERRHRVLPRSEQSPG